jgi:hypothetical protein
LGITKRCNGVKSDPFCGGANGLHQLINVFAQGDGVDDCPGCVLGKLIDVCVLGKYIGVFMDTSESRDSPSNAQHAKTSPSKFLNPIKLKLL